jgi:hypothetical protein
MTDIALLLIVPGVVLTALAIDLIALAAWIRRRWPLL